MQISNKLPSQPLNPRENVSAITLRSGKELSDIAKKSSNFEKDLVIDHSKKDEKIDTTKDDEKGKNELDDNAKEIRNSKNSHQFVIKENEKIKNLSNYLLMLQKLDPLFLND